MRKRLGAKRLGEEMVWGETSRIPNYFAHFPNSKFIFNLNNKCDEMDGIIVNFLLLLYSLLCRSELIEHTFGSNGRITFSFI